MRLCHSYSKPHRSTESAIVDIWLKLLRRDKKHALEPLREKKGDYFDFKFPSWVHHGSWKSPPNLTNLERPFDCTPPQRVNIQKLKNFALEELPDCPLREILLAESSNEVDIPTFLARMPIWLRLAKLQRRQVA